MAKKSTVDVKGCTAVYTVYIGTRRKERVVLSNPFAKTALTHQSPLSQERRRMWGGDGNGGGYLRGGRGLGGAGR
jgi:hypothetical protein